MLGWILWNGDDATPVLRNVQMFASGVFHSVAHAGDTLVVGGTVESLIITQSEQVSAIEAPAARVVGMQMEPCGSLGPLAQPASPRTTALVEVHQLGRHVPVDVTDAGMQGDHVHVHGVDENGFPIQWSIDTTADGSIESGRGFLNLMFLLFGGVMLFMMASHAGRQLVGRN